MLTKIWGRAWIFSAMAAFVMILHPPSARAGGQTALENLTSGVWEWRQTLCNNDQKAVPPEPSHYTVAFQPDGALNIRADCNRAGGRYSVEDQTLEIEVKHSTRAMCPPESLDGRFLKDLGAAAIYFFNGEYLYLDLKYDSGTMMFAR